MHSHSHVHAEGSGLEIILILILILAFVIYPLVAIYTSRTYKRWPVYRYVLWALGVLSVGAALIGPFAQLAHTNFVWHMIGHLLLGMLAPLLLALSAPMTLFLRSMNVNAARKITRLLKSRPLQFLTNPITATILNIGGLYVLYMTDLYALMHESTILYAFIHLHVFLAGYLFTISIIYVDVTSHRYSYLFRSIVLVLALAGHKVLSKYIYAYPPNGVSRAEAETGGMWMYYGGDLIDLVLIVLLCYQWYKASNPRVVVLGHKT